MSKNSDMYSDSRERPYQTKHYVELVQNLASDLMRGMHANMLELKVQIDDIPYLYSMELIIERKLGRFSNSTLTLSLNEEGNPPWGYEGAVGRLSMESDGLKEFSYKISKVFGTHMFITHSNPGCTLDEFLAEYLKYAPGVVISLLTEEQKDYIFDLYRS